MRFERLDGDLDLALFVCQPICEAVLSCGADFLFTAKLVPTRPCKTSRMARVSTNSRSFGRKAPKSSPIATSGLPARRCARATMPSNNWIGVTTADAKGEVTYDGAFVTSLPVSQIGA
jgi:hypothetical protein